MNFLWKKISNLAVKSRLIVSKGAIFQMLGNMVGPVFQPIAAATKAMTPLDVGGNFYLDRAAGITVTLPVATGSGGKIRFRILVSLTSNNYIVKVATATDYFIGIIGSLTDDATPFARAWATANTGTVGTESDTITLNLTTQGTGAKGQWLEFEDIAPNIWAVSGFVAASGAEVTPFSAGV